MQQLSNQQGQAVPARSQFDFRSAKGGWLDGRTLNGLLGDEQTIDRYITNGGGQQTMEHDDQEMMNSTMEHIYHKSSKYMNMDAARCSELFPSNEIITL